jgi:hypothetical protein
MTLAGRVFASTMLALANSGSTAAYGNDEWMQKASDVGSALGPWRLCSNLLHIAQVGEASAKQRIYSIFLAEAPVISGTV